MWLRLDDEPGTVVKASVDRQGVVILRGVAALPSETPRKPVKVQVVTENGTVIDAGEFTFD